MKTTTKPGSWSWQRAVANPVEPAVTAELFIVKRERRYALGSRVNGAEFTHAWFTSRKEAEFAAKIIGFLISGDTEGSNFTWPDWEKIMNAPSASCPSPPTSAEP